MDTLYGSDEINSALDTLAKSIASKKTEAPIALVGIQRGGVPLAHRLYERLKDSMASLELGQVDVLLYRDDGGAIPLRAPGRLGSEVDFDVEGAHIVLVDDVLFTGRTVRAAIDQLMDFGRPEKIELAVLIDRGHRQLPIQADYVGFSVETSATDHVKVELEEFGGTDQITRLAR